MTITSVPSEISLEKAEIEYEDHEGQNSILTQEKRKEEPGSTEKMSEIQEAVITPVFCSTIRWIRTNV